MSLSRSGPSMHCGSDCRVVAQLPGDAVAIVDPAEQAEAVVVHGHQRLAAVGQGCPQLIQLFL